VSRNRTSSVTSRRAANVSAPDDEASSHWMSSIATTTRSRAASRRNPFRNPSPDRPRLRRRRAGLLAEQRHVQRLPLRRRKVGQLVRGDRVQEVDHRGERQPRLGAARPGRQHAGAALPRGDHPRLPEGRLPDPRLGPRGSAPARGRRRRARPRPSARTRGRRPAGPAHCSPTPSLATARLPRADDSAARAFRLHPRGRAPVGSRQAWRTGTRNASGFSATHSSGIYRSVSAAERA
jgi:hypothetical protein